VPLIDIFKLIVDIISKELRVSTNKDALANKKPLRIILFANTIKEKAILSKNARYFTLNLKILKVIRVKIRATNLTTIISLEISLLKPL